MAHKTGFTAESLTQKLRDSGFRDVEVQIHEINLFAVAYKAV